MRRALLALAFALTLTSASAFAQGWPKTWGASGTAPGGSSTLPAAAEGYLLNDGDDTLSWEPFVALDRLAAGGGDDGDVLTLVAGEWAPAALAQLPAVDAGDNGKALLVVAGAWADALRTTHTNISGTAWTLAAADRSIYLSDGVASDGLVLDASTTLNGTEITVGLTAGTGPLLVASESGVLVFGSSTATAASLECASTAVPGSTMTLRRIYVGSVRWIATAIVGEWTVATSCEPAVGGGE